MTRPAIVSLLAVAAVGALAFAAPACTASPSAWARSADAICVRYGKEAAKIAPPTSSKSLIAASGRLAAIEQRRTSELARLKRPPADAAAIARLIGAFEQQVGTLRSLIDAVKHDDGARIKQVMADGSAQNESTVSLAKRLGAAKCPG